MKLSYNKQKEKWSEEYDFEMLIHSTGERKMVDVGKIRYDISDMKVRAKEKLWKEFLSGDKTISTRLHGYGTYRAIKK